MRLLFNSFRLSLSVYRCWKALASDISHSSLKPNNIKLMRGIVLVNKTWLFVAIFFMFTGFKIYDLAYYSTFKRGFGHICLAMQYIKITQIFDA